MQGVIVKVGGDQGIILGDDGGRYAYTSVEWRSEGVEPEVGMRIDFEVRGSDAANIYPIPDASPTPPVQPPAPAPPPPPGGSPSQPGATPSPDERFKETLGGLHTRLDDRYQPIRERIGNYGVIGVGIALIVVGALIRFGIFEGILDLIATVGILASVVVTAVGVFMLGKDEGWWERSAPPSPADAPGETVGPPQYPAGPAAPAAYQSTETPVPEDAPGESVGPPQYPAGPAAYQSGGPIQAPPPPPPPPPPPAAQGVQYPVPGPVPAPGQRPIVKKNKVVVGLLYILLGSLGGAIGLIYMGGRISIGKVILFCFCLVISLTMILWVITWPFWLIIGLIIIFRDEEKHDFWVHQTRDHAGISRGKCLTGECENTLESWQRGALGMSVPSQGYAQASAAQNPAGQTKACPYCGGTILYQAVKCRHCMADL